MTRSSQDIEREVEATRGELDRTVEALKDKMSPGQLLDELTHSLKGTGASDIFANLGTQVRENPLALAMVGAGMAWLMMGKGSHSNGSASPYSSEAAEPRFTGDYGTAEESGYGSAPSGSGMVEKARDLAGQASGAASEAASRVGEAASHAKVRIADAADHLHQSARGLGEKAGHGGETLQRSFMHALDKEPLVVGAVGLAVGVAIGAALPSTPIEDRTFGGLRDRVLDEGKSRAGEALEGAKHAASAAIEGVREEADRQGLTHDGTGHSLVERTESVVRAGVDAARDELGRAH